MRFSEFVEIEEALESMGLDRRMYDVGAIAEAGLASGLRRGLAGGALALAPFLAGGGDMAPPPGRPAAAVRTLPVRKVDWKGPRHRKMIEASKDDGRYYDSSTEGELRARAEDGDEWAMRELPWPAGHKFHRLGRPYRRNDGPHPDGLFPHAGY